MFFQESGSGSTDDTTACSNNSFASQPLGQTTLDLNNNENTDTGQDKVSWHTCTIHLLTELHYRSGQIEKCLALGPSKIWFCFAMISLKNRIKYNNI